jgi:hypothetical protein
MWTIYIYITFVKNQKLRDSGFHPEFLRVTCSFKSQSTNTDQLRQTINKDISPLTLSFLGSSTLSNCHAKHPGHLFTQKGERYLCLSPEAS